MTFAITYFTSFSKIGKLFVWIFSNESFNKQYFNNLKKYQSPLFVRLVADGTIVRQLRLILRECDAFSKTKSAFGKENVFLRKIQ